MGWGFYAGLIIFGLAVFLIVALMRRSGDHAAAEEREAFQRQQVEAVTAAAESDRKAHERMADVKAASGSEPADRIRERMRKRDPRTR